MTQPIPFTGRFKDEYANLGNLSEGKYVNVFKVKHLTDENEYAVKRIKIENIDNLEKLREEVTNLAKIKHENIVAYNTLWLEEDDQPGIPGFLFIAMELGDMTLQQWFRKKENKGERDMEFANSFWKQLTCGLSYVHDRDIVHGHLKPSDILLFCNGPTVDKKTVLKIGNFGNVKHTYNVYDEKNPESRYLAPEQIYSPVPEYQKWHKAVDYYSLGLILIELRYPMTDKRMNIVRTELCSGIVPFPLKKKAEADIAMGCEVYESPSRTLIEMTRIDPDMRCRFGFYFEIIWFEDDMVADHDDQQESQP